jgi:SAM-dependent methyltransferase
MLKQMRAVEAEQDTASTPELWAATFAASAIMTANRIRRMQRAPEWSLIRRHIPRGGSVLDAGCGFGEWVQVLESNGYKGTGVDYSATLISRLQEAYPTGSWIHSDIRNVPVSDGNFDGVISWGVIEHDEAGPDAALREFHRILRPGGIAIVSVPQDSERQRCAGGILFPSAPTMAFFQYAMTGAELAAQCRAARFEVVRGGTIPGAAFAMLAPRLCMWARTQGLAGRILERAGSLATVPFSRYHLMTFAVARKPDTKGK